MQEIITISEDQLQFSYNSLKKNCYRVTTFLKIFHNKGYDAYIEMSTIHYPDYNLFTVHYNFDNIFKEYILYLKFTNETFEEFVNIIAKKLQELNIKEKMEKINKKWLDKDQDIIIRTYKNSKII